MKITIDDLKRMWPEGACQPAQDWFREKYPDGATCDELALTVSEGWLSWVACKASPELAYRAADALLARPDVSGDNLRDVVRYASPAIAERARKELDRRNAK